MGGRLYYRLHFAESYRNSPVSKLPGRLAAASPAPMTVTLFISSCPISLLCFAAFRRFSWPVIFGGLLVCPLPAASVVFLDAALRPLFFRCGLFLCLRLTGISVFTSVFSPSGSACRHFLFIAAYPPARRRCIPSLYRRASYSPCQTSLTLSCRRPGNRP
jgi:hypothetical protein